MDYLFIGGAQDGRRITVEDNQPVVFCPLPANVELNEAPAPTTAAPPKERYTRRELRGASQKFSLYALGTMGADEMLERLIYGYQQPARLPALAG